MKEEAIVLLRGRRRRITVMKKVWKMKMLLMITSPHNHRNQSDYGPAGADENDSF